MILFSKDVGFTNTNFEWLYPAIGIGGIVGALVIGQIDKKYNLLLVMSFGLGIIGISYLFSSLSDFIFSGALEIVLFLVSWFVAGFGVSIVSIPYSTLVMNEIPKDMIGKASTMGYVANGISLLTAPLIGAYLANTFSIRMPFMATGIGFILCFFVFGFIALKITPSQKK